MVVMEHPKRSWIPNAPASWLLPELTWIRDLLNSVSVDLDQCMFDAPSQKPTTLLCLNYEHMVDAPRTAPNGAKCNHRSHASRLAVTLSVLLLLLLPSSTKGLNMLAKATHTHICAKLPNLEQRDSPCKLHDFVPSPIGAFYVPLDPYNPDQGLRQSAADFNNSSSEFRQQSLAHSLYFPAGVMPFVGHTQ